MLLIHLCRAVLGAELKVAAMLYACYALVAHLNTSLPDVSSTTVISGRLAALQKWHGETLEF